MDDRGSARAEQMTRTRVDPPHRGLRKTVADDELPGGNVLDPATRADMELRFGHDFSQVRIHAGPAAEAAAAANGALAFTAGHDVVFGGGQYQPGTLPGRWLLAHELAHVIQQGDARRRDSVTADNGLEHAAGHAAMQVALGGFARVSAAPQASAIQRATPDQGFSRALDEFAKETGETGALALLRAQSATFRGIAKTLDAHYVWLHDPSFDSATSLSSLLKIDDSGRVTEPPWAAGRRALEILPGASVFRPFRDPGHVRSADLIALQLSDADPVGSFIQAIAHEATHAEAFAAGGGKPPATLTAAIAAGIADEIAARTSEARVLSEIKNPAARKQFQPVASRRERDVQREVSPALNLTYLENSFFAWELQQAQAREKLSDELTGQIREAVDRDPSAPPPLLRGNRFEYSDYVRIWFARQGAVRDWITFAQQHQPGDPVFISEREKLLQEHAKRYFGGKASYLP